MRIAVPRESAPGERRVALVPDAVSKLVAAGFEVAVERGAGLEAGFADEAYGTAGASVVGREELYGLRRPSFAWRRRTSTRSPHWRPARS